MSAELPVLLMRANSDVRIVVDVEGETLTATRSDGTVALRFTGRIPGDALARCEAYIRRMMRAGWDATESEEMG